MKLREQGDFMKAWGGISSLQLRLPVMWTEANGRGFDLPQLVEWLCAAPARQVGFKLKGTIEVGRDADVVIWNPEREFTISPSMLHHRHKLTPYEGRELLGEVRATYLRGHLVYDGRAFVEPPTGKLLLKTL